MARKIDWDAVSKDMEVLTTKKTYERKVDTNLYSPKLKDGSADVVLRFLPTPEGDLNVPAAIVYSHAFQVNGKWVIAKCPQSLGKTHKCPICDEASNRWRSGNKSQLTKSMFHKFSAYVNVLVIKDLNTPENNGKVFVMRLGKKLYQKLIDKMNPSPEALEMGDEPIHIFDYWKGANFKLKIRTVDFVNYAGEKDTTVNYDSSEFASVSKLGTDAEIDVIESKLIPLKTYIEDEQESLDKLQARLDRAFGESAPVPEKSPEPASRPSQTATLPSAGGEEDQDAFLKNLLSND